MKNSKLLASLNKAIKAAEDIMSSPMGESTPPKEGGMTVESSGSKQKVQLKSIDFRNKRVNNVAYEPCPEGNCPPEEFTGRCCIFDPGTGWTCEEGLMATECAGMGGIFEPNKACGDKPACGTGGVSPIEESSPPSAPMM